MCQMSEGASITYLIGVISGRDGVGTGFVSQPQATVVPPLALVSLEGALAWTVQRCKDEENYIILRLKLDLGFAN